VTRAAKEGQPETVTDGEIIGRVCGGETRMFDELVRRYQDQVYGMAARFVGQAADAEDIAQEVFLKAFRGLRGFKGDAKFSTWLYRITFNLCTDWLRRNRKPGRAESPFEDETTAALGAADVGEGLLASEERREIRKALDGLPEKYRTVVTLLYYQRLSYEQIGAILDVPTKTVETRLYRARRMLRETLGDRGW
jgi:RNA polymerase sigma-70 factor (ECF subfamily)